MTTYKSVDELHESMRNNWEKERKENPVLFYLKEIYYFFYRLWNYQIKRFPKEVKYFFQRGIKGYADKDVWSFDHYLAHVILAGLLDIKKSKAGIPATIDPTTNTREYDEKRWNDILDRMIDGFMLLVDCVDGDRLEYGGWISANENGTREENRERMNLLFKDLCRFTTEEEEKKIEEAFNLFRDNFFNLWT